MSTPAWAPDRVVDEELAAHLVRTQFPDLAGLPVRWFAAGWDNAVYAVGPDLLFRFVHRSVAVPLAERELMVLRVVDGRLPLPVPRPTYVGRPVPEFDRPFWGAPRIPGTEIAMSGLPDGARVHAARALGEFLRALHAPEVAQDVVDAARAQGVTVPVDPNRRGEPVTLRDRAAGRLVRLAQGTLEREGLDRGALEREGLDRGALEREGLDRGALDHDGLLAVLDAAVAAGPSVGPQVLLHGDLHVRHVLVAADGSVTGVIDWGDTGLGDPAIDLMIGYAAFVGAAREAFLTAYGPVEPGADARARAVAVNGCAALLESAIGDGDAVLAKEAAVALHRVLQP
ncbi:phosphotransferase [Actinotalea sp. Marseille-Q4924]|uniref:phosphotransferase n=1 Tax=Actinotalea sp. Marseille-Q4924 TaxID=2866571 RepID=UPI001CE469D9|nr:phosphotransferase [Actinotalea sp. Marseille-Q4924]